MEGDAVYLLEFWIVVSTILHFLIFLSVTLHALNRRRNASATLLWIFVAWSLPVLGALLYLAFGIDRLPSKGLDKRYANKNMVEEQSRRHAGDGAAFAHHLAFGVKTETIESPLLRQTNRAIDALDPNHPLLHANRVIPLLSGSEAYPEMLAAIRNAKRHVHMQSFIFGNDAQTVEFLDALKAKAQEGVKIKLLYDRFGSTRAHLGGLFKKYRDVENMEIHGWTQANVFRRQFQINLRNHRKNLVVDGRIAFFGGVNVSLQNVGPHPIRDYHFKAEGPIVHELQFSFLCDWHFITEESPDTLVDHDHFPEIRRTGDALARLVDSGPALPPGLATEAFFLPIVLAQRQVLIVTPYFVPGAEILHALKSTARRGVEVRIVLPEKNNHRYAGLAAKALYEELLEAGVHVHERRPPFIHAKAMIVDDAMALVGTANLDVRSLALNYETMVMLSDEEAIDRLKLIIHEDLANSREIRLELWRRRSARQRLAENLCSLMTPVL